MPQLLIRSTVFIACLFVAAAAATAQDASPGIVKILRGVTTCSNPSKGIADCGSDDWTMYVHRDGSRYLHVASDNSQYGETVHAMVWIDPAGGVREAFSHMRTLTAPIGSTFVVLDGDHADVAVNDRMLDRAGDGMVLEHIDAFEHADTIGVGPATFDGLHFFSFDIGKGGDQPSGIYWIGGTRMGTMTGGFVTSEFSYLGESTLTLADDSVQSADHFQMVGGTELWLTKEDRALLRMKLEFLDLAGTIYDTVSLTVTEPELSR